MRQAGEAEKIGEALPDQRLRHVTHKKRRDGDAELGAGEGEGELRGDAQRTLGCCIPLVGKLLEAAPVHGDVGELLGHEVTGGRGKSQNGENSDGDQQSDTCWGSRA